MSEDVTMESLGFVESLGVGAGSQARSHTEASGGPRRFYGKYRGVVADTIDVERRGRIKVTVTDVHGPRLSSWALPCMPFGGKQTGLFATPLIGARVWVEFEHGDPDYPIWTGCWWDKGDPPTEAAFATPAMPTFIVGSTAKSAIVLSDTPIAPMAGSGGVLLKGGPTSYIHIGPNGITIVSPKVDFNMGALTVT